jgi:transcription elongation factor Elf1
MEHQKYLRQERAKADKAQTRFTDQGFIFRPRLIVKHEHLDINETVNCPFCLFEAPLRKFLVSTKKGLSVGKAKCPDCDNTMFMDTLTAERTIQEYALWCFDYAKSDFWGKVPFQKFKMRLKMLGVSQEFWDKYKQLKGTYEEE